MRSMMGREWGSMQLRHRAAVKPVAQEHTSQPAGGVTKTVRMPRKPHTLADPDHSHADTMGASPRAVKRPRNNNNNNSTNNNNNVCIFAFILLNWIFVLSSF